MSALSLIFFIVCCRTLACESSVWHKMPSGVPTYVLSCEEANPANSPAMGTFLLSSPIFFLTTHKFLWCSCSVFLDYLWSCQYHAFSCLWKAIFPVLNQRFIFKRSCRWLWVAFLTTHFWVLFCGDRQIQELLSRCKHVFKKIGCMTVKSVNMVSAQCCCVFSSVWSVLWSLFKNLVCFSIFVLVYWSSRLGVLCKCHLASLPLPLPSSFKLLMGML